MEGRGGGREIRYDSDNNNDKKYTIKWDLVTQSQFTKTLPLVLFILVVLSLCIVIYLSIGWVMGEITVCINSLSTLYNWGGGGVLMGQ